MAFGTRYELFYFVYHSTNPSPVSPVTNNSYSEEVAAKTVDPEPMHRHIQLIPGDEPLDLRDDEGRKQLNWLDVIRETRFVKRQVYEPINNEYVPIPKEPKETKKTEMTEDVEER